MKHMNNDALQKILDDMNKSLQNVFTNDLQCGKLYWVLPKGCASLQEAKKSQKYIGYNFRPMTKSVENSTIFLYLVNPKQSIYGKVSNGKLVPVTEPGCLPFDQPVMILKTCSGTSEYIELLADEVVYKNVLYIPENINWKLMPATEQSDPEHT